MSPATVVQDAAVTTIYLAPEFVGQNSQIFLRSPAGDWLHTNLTFDGAIFQFTLPVELTSEPGLVLVSTEAGVDEFNPPLPLLIVDSTLPQLLSAEEFWAASVEVIRDETGGAREIRVFGSDFTNGMKVVLGSGKTPGFAMETTFIDDVTLEAKVPGPTLGDSSDLFVAVLAADRQTMSEGIPIEPLAGAAYADDEEGETRDPLAGFTPQDVELTSVNPVAPGLLVVRGVGLVEGGEVTFSVKDRDGQVRTATSTIEGVVPVSSSSTAARSGVATQEAGEVVEMQGSISVNLPQKNIPVAKLTGVNDSGRVVVTSALQQVPAQEEATIALGGSYPFGVYKLKNQPNSTARFIFLQCDVDETRYELVENAATTSIELRQGTNPHEQIRREVEPNVTSLLYVRGIGLTTSLDDTPVERGLAELRLTSDQSVTRRVRVQEASLGADRHVPAYPAQSDQRCLSPNRQRHYEVDCLINKFADRHHVPPQVVKAQVAQETQFDKNFRHEPSTIDLKNLSGDGTQTLVNGDRRINTEPFVFYRIPGSYLAAGSRPVPVTIRHDQPLQLPQGVKRHQGFTEGPLGPGESVPSPLERRSTIRNAVLRRGDGTAIRLIHVHCDSIFRRLHYQNPDPGVAPADLAANQFCVNYDTGALTLGTSLAPGDTVSLSYYPLNPTIQVIPGRGLRITGQIMTPKGSLTTQEILADRELVRLWPIGGNVVRFRETDSMAQHFQRNVGNDLSGLPQPEISSGFSRAGFLSGTDSDKIHELKVAGSAPTKVRDPKLWHATAQFWASSSYGPMQVTLPLWVGRDDTPELDEEFAEVYPLSGAGARNLVDLLWDYPKALELGVVFDKHLYRARNVTNPNSVTVGAAWAESLYRYNGRRAYGREVLILSNDNYEPR
jgi:hypothetical protein